jgi:hypothetical protein
MLVGILGNPHATRHKAVDALDLRVYPLVLGSEIR